MFTNLVNKIQFALETLQSIASASVCFDQRCHKLSSMIDLRVCYDNSGADYKYYTRILLKWFCFSFNVTHDLSVIEKAHRHEYSIKDNLILANPFVSF